MDGFLWQDLGLDQQQQQPPLPVHGNARAPQEPAIAQNINNAVGNIHLEVEEDGNNQHDVDIWNVNNILDGGSAMEGKSNVQCDMSVYLIFTGTAAPLGVQLNHPVYSPGCTVEIFLDRSITLSTLFQRYCAFANTCPNNFITPKKIDPRSSSSSSSTIMENHDLSSVLVDPSDLEFYHCSVLDPSQTVDTSALMHKDKIRVRAYQRDEKKHQMERLKLQQEMDKNYFDQLRLLMPDVTPSFMKCDIIFHCTGRTIDDKGLKQEVLNTHVKGNAALISKRCSWLKIKIALAKLLFEQQQQPLVSRCESALRPAYIPEGKRGPVVDERNHMLLGMESFSERVGDHANGEYQYFHEEKAVQPHADDVDINDQQQFHQNVVFDEETNSSMNAAGSELWQNHVEVDPLYQRVNDNHFLPSTSAHPVEDDEDDQQGSTVTNGLMGFHDSNQHLAPIITLNHPPEAVKLLLEYCYTNRVISLGYDAYIQSFKPLDPVTTDPLIEKYGGAVSPFHPNTPSSWPNHGLPTISLPIALAGIQLSEEASIPRLSLMCEIAASNLVTTTSALDVLGFCEIQQRRSANRLTILRKAVMINHIFMEGPKGILHLSNTYSLHRTLRDKKDTVIPGLFWGVKDALQDVSGPKMQAVGDPINDIRDRKAMLLITVMDHFDRIDQDDKKLRSRERKEWRKQKRMRRSMNPFLEETGNSHTKEIVHDCLTIDKVKA